MRFASFLLLLLFSVAASAAELQFAETALSIGADQTSSLESLRASFDLRPVTDSAGEYLLLDKGASVEAGVAGMLYFQDGRLKWASRRLATVSGTRPSSEILSALNAALMRIAAEQGQSAQIKAAKGRESGHDVERLVFEFPGKILALRVGTSKEYGTAIWLDETFPR
jgi:hypothetical protein